MILSTKKPREQSGRDSFGRFRAQCRSAAIAALSILEDKDVDRVYCDLHDDFVVRKLEGNDYGYIFYQVKTKSKQNHTWSLNDLFGVKKKPKVIPPDYNKKVKNSFLGKLILHTIVFDKNCNSVVFETNLNNKDEVESVIADIDNGKFAEKFTKTLISRFNKIYADQITTDLSEDEIKEKLSKLQFQTDIQHLKVGDNNFTPAAKDMIYRFSEIDLGHSEADEILSKLLELVESKSEGVISEWTEENIENKAGISINDLLSILSISKEAYHILSSGGDIKAIKNASIIQRTLEKVKAPQEVIEYCSESKIKWDNWYRNNRHIISDLDFLTIHSRISTIIMDAKDESGSIKIDLFRQPIRDLISTLTSADILYGLDEDTILGGIFSEVVRGKS